MSEATAEFELKRAVADARVARAEAERAAEAERERIERHRELMALYDSMTPEELRLHVQTRARVRNQVLFKDRPISQPLAPGPPRVYDMRGPLPPAPPPVMDPTGSWVGSRLPPSPPPSPPAA